MSKLIMSASGVRGIVGETLDPSIALEIGKAFASYLGTGTVIVGGDTRSSHHVFKHAVMSGLLACGCDVMDIGYAPTPTCQQMIAHHQAQGAVVITASHNPIQWNGLKLMNQSGSFLNDQEYNDFNAILESKDYALKTWDNIGHQDHDPKAISHHIDKVLAGIDTAAIKNSGLRVLIDPNNGAGAVANGELLERLGVDYDMINGSITEPFKHDPEPLEKNLSEIKDVLREGDYDIGFVQDADADRLVILDETGRFIGEDYSLSFCLDYVLQKEATENTEVVVNLSTSMVINDIAAKYNATVLQTKIGETHVTQAIKERSALVGGEGNGGIIYPKIGWGRDSLVGITLALCHLAEAKKSVSEIVSTYPPYTMIRDKIALNSREDLTPMLERLKAQFKTEKQDHQDGLKILLDKAWIHVRPSNTEPIARIFIEAESLERATELLDSVKVHA